MKRTVWTGKWILSWIVFVIVFLLGGMLFPVSPELIAKISPADSKYLMLALVVVTLCETFLLNYLISNSRISGWPLMGALIGLTWGIQTFMTQIETLVFIKAFPDLNTLGVIKIMLSELIVFICVIPFTMLLHGKWKQQPTETVVYRVLKKKWYFWLPVISLTYVALYFIFGLFPISFPEAKDFYAAWINSQNSLSGIALACIQSIRGLFWLAFLLPLFFILKGTKERKMVLAAIVMGVFTAFQLMYPNGLMPPVVRFGHFVEVFSEMLIFGALVGWMVVAEDNIA